MLRALRCRLAVLLALTGVNLLLPVGCGQPAPAPPLSKEVGTTATVGLPASDPPVLSRTLAERIKPGMTQDAVLSILQDAASATPSAKSMIDAAATQARLNNLRYDLTVMQGKHKLVLGFREQKLAEMRQEGFEE